MRRQVDLDRGNERAWLNFGPGRQALGSLKAYPQREFTMQYNESTGAFLRRLWKRRGISWFIQPGAASERGSDETPLHTLVLFDDAMSLKQNGGAAVRYHRDDATEVRDVITVWHAVRTLTPGKIGRQSWVTAVIDICINELPDDNWETPLDALKLPEPFEPKSKRFGKIADIFDEGTDAPGTSRDRERVREEGDPYDTDNGGKTEGGRIPKRRCATSITRCCG